MRRPVKPGAILATGAMAAMLWSPAVVRPGNPTLAVDVPAEEVADWPFDVTATWDTDAPRTLSVALLRATSCGDSLGAGLELDPAGLVVIQHPVTEPGTSVAEATLVRFGSYLACGYLTSSTDPHAPADAVAQAPIEITTFSGSDPTPPTSGIVCGDVGGPSHITRVRAFAIRCRTARRVARRWGRETNRDAVGSYRCRTRGRKVICTASNARKVTFRFR